MVVTFVFARGSAIAQTGFASISGRVADGAGAVIPKAGVTLKNLDTDVTQQSESNRDGIYSFASVLPGRYLMHVQKQGFRSVDVTSLTLYTQDQAERNFTLEVGSASESITVSADENSVNTSDASVSTVIDRQFVENLPLNGRSFQSLLYITPGVNLNAGGGATGAEGSTGQFVVNGQRADANYWMIDGVSANVGINSGEPGTGASGSIGASNSVGGTSAMVSLDALQEFRILTSTYAPEFGRTMGGQISIQTRSGTNQVHGTLFEYLRNTDLDAADWFVDHYGLRKAAEIQNDFGGVLGGPIIKDKTFFLLSLEALRVLQPYTQVSTVPDLASRALAVPAMQPFMNMYPLPAAGAADTSQGSGIAPYTATFSNPSKANAYSLRIDHQVEEKLNLFFRYSHAPSGASPRGGLFAANFVSNSFSVTKTATAGATWTESAEVVNDARANYSVGGAHRYLVTDSFGGGTPMPDVNIFPSPFSYANSLLALLPTFGTGMYEWGGFYAANYQHQFNLVDTLSIQRSAHSLKFGLDYRRLTPDYGQSTYQSVPIWSNIREMEQGTCFLMIEHNVPGTFLLRNLGAFAQDTWRVGPRVNLTFGARWDVDFRPITEAGISLPRLSGFSLTDLSNLALGPAGRPAYDTHFANVAPRIGGAYRLLTGDDWGLVLRAGFGLFYGLASTEIANPSAIGGPYYPYGSIANYATAVFPTKPDDPDAQLPPVAPPNAANANTLYGLDPNLNLPYALQWNAALEQSLGKAQSFTLSYIGASDRRLLQSESVSNPNANYASAFLVAGTGNLSYSALQAEFQRRLTRGFQALIAYTWSHSIDDGSYGAYANGGFAAANANRGDSDYDLRNVFTAAVTYHPSQWKKSWLTRAFTNNWSTDNIVQLRSGAPVDVQDASFTALSRTNASVLIRPDVVPGQPEYLTGPQYAGRRAINPNSFQDPPTVYDPALGIQVPTRQGTLKRNARRALGLKQWDFSAHRDFPVNERLKLQFRAELFNILNHPNFAAFNNQFEMNNGSPLFGLSTQMLNQSLGGVAGSGGQQNPLYAPGGPRSGEFALKLIF